jgi:hypothetical protein
MLRCSKTGHFRDSPKIGLDSETKRLTFARVLQKLATPSGHQAISVKHIGSSLIAEIIAGNMMEGAFSPMVSGRKIFATFGFCDIRKFTDTTECLKEK